MTTVGLYSKLCLSKTNGTVVVAGTSAPGVGHHVLGGVSDAGETVDNCSVEQHTTNYRGESEVENLVTDSFHLCQHLARALWA